MADLHHRIMNIPITTPRGYRSGAQPYLEGHRDARHAAADLAATHLARLREILTFCEEQGLDRRGLNKETGADEAYKDIALRLRIALRGD